MQFEVGQEVAIRQIGVLRRYTMATVERVTATQIVVKAGDRTRRFRLDGHEAGKTHYGFLIESTPQIRDAARKAELLEALERVKWPTLPLSTLERVAAALEEG